MPSTIDAIQQEIAQASASGFRGRLLARGQARSMIWRNGVLPPNAPAFSPRLSYDLLSYGYALLGQGLRLREIGGEETSARIAFEQAATALESVIAKGSPEDPDRNFHFVLAAAAYQLAHLSARAYSLLSVIRTDENFSPIESALISMMLRDFEALDQQVLNSRASEEGGDASILDTFTEEWEALPEDGVTPDAERSEPPRVCRRPFSLRDWGHEQEAHTEVFP